MDTLISFDDLQGGGKSLKKLLQAFMRAGAPVAASDVDPRTRRTAGINYRQVQVTMTDSQIVTLGIKASGDIYEVKVNGSVLPIKAQDDQRKAVGEIVKALDAGRAKFQAKLARQKVALPKGITTAAPKMEERLAQISAQLDGRVADAKIRVNELRAELGEPVLDGAGEFPRLEPDGNRYGRDQYIYVDADEAGELPAVLKLKSDAVPVLDGVTIPDASELDAGERDTLKALALRNGKLEDGDVPSKVGRDGLVEKGLVERVDGDNLLTAKGKGCAATLDDASPVEMKDLGRSWLGFKLVDITAAMQASAMALPARHRMSGAVRLSLNDEDGKSIPVLGTVVAISFRSGKVLYSVAVPLAPLVEGGRQVMAVVPDVPSEMVEPAATLGMALDSVGYGAELKACSAAVLDAVDVPANSFADPSVIEAQQILVSIAAGDTLDDADYSRSINALRIALDTVETNYPINVAEGDLAQAELEEKSAADFRAAINALELKAAEQASQGSSAA